MPYIYFGFEPRNRGASKLAVKTDSGEMEPAEPSRVKVFTQVVFSPIWSLMTSLLGLAVAILSYPQYSYVSTASRGLMTNPAQGMIPLKTPGLAVVLRKGVSLSVENVAKLEDAGFSAMQYSGRTVWLKENGQRDDFTMADQMDGVDPLGPHPALYLNTHSFRAFLVLRSFTTRVCETFHYLCENSSPMSPSLQSKISIPDNEIWKDASKLTGTEDIQMPESHVAFKFKKSVARVAANGEKGAASVVIISGAADVSPSWENTGVVTNHLERPYQGFIRPGRMERITAPGRIFKFNPQLALPDPNLIGDIIGRYFLAGLGDSYDDQLENLDLLKTGVAGLRLTRVGEELTHLYKCIEIAIQAQTGCVPIFSKMNYEGCVLMGGATERNFIVHGKVFPALSVTELKADILLVSDHESSLHFISTLFPGELKEDVTKCESFFELRNLCLELAVTQDTKDEIIRKASMLDFGRESWAISPINLKACMDLISSFSSLDSTYPIGRMSLFSKDPVLVALSCFGEKTAPSWDIPNGTTCSLSKANPPSPPLAASGKSRTASKGEISDATWVMVIRKTDLFSAVDEFRKMASTLKYRSSSSALAKRVGHRVFSRERMAEFWGPMREALRVINPLAAFERDEGTLKRGATSSSATERGESEGGGKKRRMGF
jgi:hypothetical protein